MSMSASNLGRGTFTRHLMTRQHKQKSRKRTLMMSLSLTSMVDMFSLLVIFLLQTFSTSPQLMAVAKDVALPVAASGQEIKDAPVLALTNEAVFLDQKEVGKTKDLLKNPAPLMKQLAEQRKLWIKDHPNDAFRGEINLQADRELPGTMISQFMGMLPSQHYGSILLAVVGAGGH
jgi:biopolymer transport protein ExbD